MQLAYLLPWLEWPVCSYEKPAGVRGRDKVDMLGKRFRGEDLWDPLKMDILGRRVATRDLLHSWG